MSQKSLWCLTQCLINYPDLIKWLLKKKFRIGSAELNVLRLGLVL